ncbi:MAG: hypothetical protein H7A49_07320 [Akkermansiaceae bacterium]|nr:hypothetical protein [Akkermansiaceae bacterium]
MTFITVEAVVDDVRVGQPGLDGGLIGSGTVDADGCDAGPLFFGELLEEGLDAFLFASLPHVEEFAGLAVEDDGDVAVPFADGLLVDEELGQPVEAWGRRVRLRRSCRSGAPWRR